MMQRRRLSERIDLFFPKEEAETADLVEQAVACSLPIIRQKWGLSQPRRIRVFVVTAWLPAILRSIPWYLLPAGLLALPFWALRFRRLWPAAGGWTQAFRGRPVVCIKPPWLVEKGDRTIGEMLFVKEPDPRRKVEHITCHELTHALAGHLRLPAWLNEGIAMLSVDTYLGKPTVRADTLRLLPGGDRGRSPEQYRKLLGMKLKAIAGQYARAYWVTRFLEEQHPGFLRHVLAKKASHRSIERQLAKTLGLPRRDLWRSIDRIVTAHFGGESQ